MTMATPSPDQPETELERKRREWIERVVAEAPPLTQEQIDKLKVLLRPPPDKETPRR